jgi:hypothetical protein
MTGPSTFLDSALLSSIFCEWCDGGPLEYSKGEQQNFVYVNTLIQKSMARPIFRFAHSFLDFPFSFSTQNSFSDFDFDFNSDSQ